MTVKGEPLKSLVFDEFTRGVCCEEPDGPCEGCDEAHAHTCIVCGEDWCAACWDGVAHAEFCPKAEREARLA